MTTPNHHPRKTTTLSPTCEITINGRQKLTVNAGSSLFQTLRSHKIFVPSTCGGRGACGRCRLKILEGAGPLTPADSFHLSKQELAANVRLSCQVKVRRNLLIQVPDEVLAIREFHATVDTIRPLTYDIKQLHIRLNDPPEMNFTPGQYIQLLVPNPDGRPQSVFRAYSMSSPPSRKNAFELIVRLVPRGICTTWIFNTLKENDPLSLIGPYGDFKLTDSGRQMLWIAGGSGMAPFWAMARHMAENNIQRKCTYFFGAVSRKDLFLVDEFRDIESKLPNFTFIPALSNPEESDRWDGETGLITEVAGRHVPQSPDAEAYLCGSGGMINACINVLKNKAIPQERIYYDKFA